MFLVIGVGSMTGVNKYLLLGHPEGRPLHEV